ncbi:unnamed protein product, partial [Echinostoma caproni]|uniref:tRNA dimethylallyltransferase n=1 Tax=Echinostoma caproni TaxID=27848 RepID=A0A183ALW6_9TREM
TVSSRTNGVVVTSDEANGIPHHLLGTFPASWAGRIDVRDYRDRCLPLIDTIRENKHIPILAGGTHYYLESVLWSDFSAGLNQTVSNNIELQTSVRSATHGVRRSSMESMVEPQQEDSNECYAQLKQINPSMAAKLHPNNVRKVRRALAEALMRQNSSEQVTTTEPIRARPDDGPPNRSYQPRYPGQTLIFWTDCDGEVLNTRLDQRVDSMIEAGLVHELDQFVTRFFSSYEDHGKYFAIHSLKIQCSSLAITNFVARFGIMLIMCWSFVPLHSESHGRFPFLIRSPS